MINSIGSYYVYPYRPSISPHVASPLICTGASRTEYWHYSTETEDAHIWAMRT